MLKLDNSLLDELGLGSLPEDQKRAMLQHIYETLELRVGTNLANQMSDAQLQEFEKFIDDGGDANQAQALQWLEANLPNYKQVVNDVFEALKLEVKAMAPQLAAASGVAPGAAPAPAMPADSVGGAIPQQGQPMHDTYQQPPAPAPMNYAQPANMQPAADPFGTTATQPAPADYFAPPAPAPGGFAPSAPAPTSAPAFAQPAAPAQSFAPAADPQAFQPQDQGQYGQDFSAPQQQGQPFQDSSQQPPATQPSQQPQQDNNGYQFPQQQPPAGPGYPPQHPPAN